MSLIPGFMLPSVMGGVDIAYRNSTAAGTSGSTTITVNVPSGVANGDLLVFAMFANNTCTISSGLSGWTSRLSDVTSSTSIQVYTRTASSEPASYSPVFSASSAVKGIILAYSGPSNSYDVIGTATKAGTNPSTAAAITATNQGLMLGVFGTLASIATVTTPPSGMTQRILANAGSQIPSIAVYDMEVAVGATAAKTLTWSFSTNTAGVQLSIS